MKMKTKLNDLFDQLEPEKGNSLDGKIKIEETKGVKRIQKLYDFLTKPIDFTYEEYKIAIESLKEKFHPNVEAIDKEQNGEDAHKKKFTAKDLYCFSVLNNNLNGDGAKEGAAVSLLINYVDEQDVFFKTPDSAAKYHALGASNIKNLTVLGDVGDSCGESMKSGKILVKGSAGNNLGFLMSAGQIFVEGSISSLARVIKGGDIYHKGKLIVKDGQVLDESYLRK